MNVDSIRFHYPAVSGGATVSMRERIRRKLRLLRHGHEALNKKMRMRLEERQRERNRIARELQDTLVQGLFGATTLLRNAVEELPADACGRETASRALRTLESVLEEASAALQGLRSPRTAPASIEDALFAVGEEFATDSRFAFRVLVYGERKPCEPTVQEQIYLIGREAVVNAARHSQATKIEAEVEYLRRGVRVLVRDNGCGIDPQILRSGRDSHWGLTGMRERAEEVGGRLRIQSAPGQGTEVEISIRGDIAAWQ